MSIDFKNGVTRFSKLKEVDNGTFDKVVSPILVDGEQIVASFRGIRDGVIFTDKRIISINVQGIVGKKKDFTSMLYNKIQIFAVETAGAALDYDTELEMWFSGVGKVTFEFSYTQDILAICKFISEKTL